MDLALYDLDVLAHALVDSVRDGDQPGLASYSDTCLRHVWKYQEFAVAMTYTMHDAGDPSLRGGFRQQVALAKLDDCSTRRPLRGCTRSISKGSHEPVNSAGVAQRRSRPPLPRERPAPFLLVRKECHQETRLHQRDEGIVRAVRLEFGLRSEMQASLKVALVAGTSA